MRIRVIDLETTGFAPPHTVCEIGYCDVVAEARDLLGGPASWSVGKPQSHLIYPGRPIPPETSAVHHIVDEDVRHAPTWDEVAPLTLRDGDGDAIVAFAAHSAKFEQQWCTPDLTGPAAWICTYKCALRLWPDAPSHSNQALRYLRRPIGLDRNIASVAHRAGPDAYVTAFHLRDMLDIAPIEDLVKWSSEPALQVICHIGKYRGSKWAEVDSGFMRWLLDRDFDEDVHFTCRHWLEKREADQRAAFVEGGHGD